MSVYIMSAVKRNDLAKALGEKHNVTFVHDGARYFIAWNDVNEAWMMDLYLASDAIEDQYDLGLILPDSLEDEYQEWVSSMGGVLCTGEALDAVEFFMPSVVADITFDATSTPRMT